MTGPPRKTVRRTASDDEPRRREANLNPEFKAALGPDVVCKLFGGWIAKYGSTGAG